MRKPDLTVKGQETTTEIYALSPGELFPGFGGSRSGLKVGRTPSIVVRTLQAGSLSDVEYGINDPQVWKFIAKAINGVFDATATT